jgi:Zn-dependent protease
MRRGLLIGRLFGTNIYCEFSFFMLIGLYFLMASAAAAAVFSVAVLVSILVHEFGHVLAVRKLLRTESIVVLWMLGGLTIYRGAPKPGQQASISLLGPAFSFALGAASYGAALLLLPVPPRLFTRPPESVLDAFLYTMIWINLVWTCANLLPALPLDGGQALRAGLRAVFRRDRADRAMRVISVLTAAGIVGAGLYLKLVFAAVLGAFLLLDNLKSRPVAYH